MTTLFRLTLAAFILCVPALGQSEREYIDRVDHYRITLSGDWRPITYADGIGRQITEFVCRDRDQGLLKITKEDLAGQTLASKIQSDLAELRLRVACAYSGQEDFSDGQLSGKRVALYYYENDRQIRGTSYYLQDGESVWVLRFTAREKASGLTGDLADKMARSFCPVCPIP